MLLKNASSDLAFGVQFRTDQLPCFALWKNEISEPDGFVTGLEPATNFPNHHSFEKQQGRVVSLDPGGNCSFDLRLQVCAGASQVGAAEEQINALCQGDPTVHAQPLSNWSAGS